MSPSDGVDPTRESNSVGEKGVLTPYLGNVRASLNGVSSLLDAGVSTSVSVARSERRVIMSGVWNGGASMVALPEMSESDTVGGPVGRYARMGENVERRKEERVERVGAEPLEADDDMRRCP